MVNYVTFPLKNCDIAVLATQRPLLVCFYHPVTLASKNAAKIEGGAKKQICTPGMKVFS